MGEQSYETGYKYLTESFNILQPENPSLGEIYVIRNRQSTAFEVLKP